MLPNLQPDQIVRLRKPHPCGEYKWKVLRIGADIKIECLGCGRQVMLSRRKLARQVKEILPATGDAKA